MKRIQLMKQWVCASAMCLALLAGVANAKNVFTHRFIRIAANSSKESDIAAKKVLLQRAASVGYNGYFYDDSRISYIPSLGKKTTDRMKDICAHARSLGMTAMPMNFGQLTPANDNINNAEGFPVIGTPFLVSGNTATLQSDHIVEILNGGFEGDSNWRFVGTGISIGDGRSGKGLYLNNPSKARAIQAIKVKKQRAYKISVWVKTENCGDPKKVTIDVYDTSKRFYLLKRVYGSFSTWEDQWGTRPTETMSWRQFTIDFNSFESETVEIWLRASSIGKSNTGSVWYDDIKIEESGLFEPVIRSTTPIVVKSGNGSITYEVGKDYVVGNEILTIPDGSSIKDGELLKVDWFQRGDMIGNKSAASFCHPEAWRYLWEHAVKSKEIFGDEGMWVKYSEWRTAFWDPACHTQYKNSLPAYMGGVQRQTNDMLRHVYGNCNLPLYLWSDTFDPYHNSKKGAYYQVNGDSYGNFNYMDPKTIIVNWNVNDRVKSYLFFAGKDPQHVLKRPMKQIINAFQGFELWLNLLDSAEALGLPDTAVIGINYCTWSEDNYDGVEPFAKMSQARGRWGSGPIPKVNVSTDCTLELPDTGTGLPASVKGSSVLSALGRPLVSKVTQAHIQYRIPKNAQVQVHLLNAMGQMVHTFVDRVQNAGEHTIQIDKKGLPCGVYFLRLKTHMNGSGLQELTRKWVVM